jgi:hypothetical protein
MFTEEVSAGAFGRVFVETLIKKILQQWRTPLRNWGLIILNNAIHD